MAGMAFDETAHGGDFVGVKNGSEISFFLIEDGGEGSGHAHVFVRENDARLAGGADAEGMKCGDGGRGEADVLLVIPYVFEARGFDAELLPQFELELAD